MSPHGKALIEANNLVEQSFQNLREALSEHRFSSLGIERKIIGLCDPYDIIYGSGYLIGYLLIKQLWMVAIEGGVGQLVEK